MYDERNEFSFLESKKLPPYYYFDFERAYFSRGIGGSDKTEYY
jgi:hypothetical protein